MIVSLSGPKGVGKDTVAKIWHIITENPHFNDDAVLNFIERDLYPPGKWLQKKWAAIPNTAYALITGVNYSNLPREEKEKERKKFISFADYYMKICFGDDIWVNRLIFEYQPYDKGVVWKEKPENLSKGYRHSKCHNCEKSFTGEKRALYCNSCIEDNSVQRYPNWLISDTRLKIEFDKVKELDGVNIYISRSDIEIDYSHRTETELIVAPFDYFMQLRPGDLRYTIALVRDLTDIIDTDRNVSDNNVFITQNNL